MNQQSSQQERLTETAQRFAEMFAEYPVATSSNSAEDINATGRFNVRNYGSRRIILSADDTEDLQDDNEETTESNREEINVSAPFLSVHIKTDQQRTGTSTRWLGGKNYGRWKNFLCEP